MGGDSHVIVIKTLTAFCTCKPLRVLNARNSKSPAEFNHAAMYKRYKRPSHSDEDARGHIPRFELIAFEGAASGFFLREVRRTSCELRRSTIFLLCVLCQLLALLSCVCGVDLSTQLGEDGLLPATRLMSRVQQHLGHLALWEKMLKVRGNQRSRQRKDHSERKEALSRREGKRQRDEERLRRRSCKVSDRQDHERRHECRIQEGETGCFEAHSFRSSAEMRMYVCTYFDLSLARSRVNLCGTPFFRTSVPKRV